MSLLNIFVYVVVYIKLKIKAVITEILSAALVHYTFLGDIQLSPAFLIPMRPLATDVATASKSALQATWPRSGKTGRNASSPFRQEQVKESREGRELHKILV